MQKAIAFAACATPVMGTASPIAKVITMISDLEVKVIAEGETSQAEFAKFSEWCEERARDLTNEIKTGKAEKEELTAAIEDEAAKQESLTTKVEELAADIASNQKDLDAATIIRDKEFKDFSAEEKELSETIGMLGRATRILEKEMGGGASMLQMKNAGSVAEALSVMVSASLIDVSDASKLTAFIQSSESDEEAGAPDAAVYESKSGGIVDALEDLKEKAETQLDETRKKETAAKNNYNMLKQSLTDEVKFANKDMDAAKKSIAESSEKKSTSEGDLKVTSKELASDTDVKEQLHSDCMTRAEEFESTTNSRGGELKALATAKKVIKEATGAASSFLQVSTSNVGRAATRMLRDLARKEHSTGLAQLASRMESVIRTGGRDPFAKVKDLITEMIGKLEKAADADAVKKAYCDKELSETNTKKDDKTDEIEALTTRIDQATSKSAKLKEEVSILENELSKLAKSQAEMDKIRAEEKDIFDADKAENEKALAGIKKALQVLRDYYAKDDSHGSSDGAASGILGLLEVVESDITKTLASLTSEEETAIAEYESETKKNEIDKTTKEQDVKYKTKESKELDKTIAEDKADKTGVVEELDAVKEYLSKIEDECIAKAETYEDRVKRRNAELAGLKDALQILESEAALVQKSTKRTTLRR